MKERQLVVISGELHDFFATLGKNPEEGMKILIKENIRIFNHTAKFIKCADQVQLSDLDDEFHHLLHSSF